ncbi:hypothetical protein T492DRAFT_998559 [Pavlovales sp. CCMP2436]|nr:hypothetical protein T492DRAFT_998559 [Pavlovales sp. CCMP2436]
MVPLAHGGAQGGAAAIGSDDDGEADGVGSVGTLVGRLAFWDGTTRIDDGTAFGGSVLPTLAPDGRGPGMDEVARLSRRGAGRPVGANGAHAVGAKPSAGMRSKGARPAADGAASHSDGRAAPPGLRVRFNKLAE